MNSTPVMTVVAGPAGAGKTTLIDTFSGDLGFPGKRLVAHAIPEELLSEELLAAIGAQQSFVVEARLDSPTVLTAMARAAERGFAVELVVVDVDSEKVLSLRCKATHGDAGVFVQEKYAHHLPGAVDLARRVLLIDNSAAQPISSELRRAGPQLARAGEGPSWFTNKVTAPMLQRIASREALKQVSFGGRIKPFVQAATPWGRPSQGVIIQATQHHALQQVGQALHLVHDLALLPFGPLLVQGAIAVIAYEAKADRGEERAREPDAGPKAGEHAERSERERGDRSAAR